MAIAKLSIDIEARLANLQSGLDKAAQIAEKNSARMSKAFSGASSAMAGLGAGASVTAAMQQFSKAVDIADKIDDLAEKYGIAAGTLSQYRYAAEVAGTPTDALAAGLGKLSKAASEGNNGLKLIGISTKDAAGNLKNADTLLLEVADRFAQYEDGAGKAALAQEIFGKSGADMIPLLNRGAAGVRELRDEAIQLGAAFGGDVAKAAGDFNDNMSRIGMAIEGAKVSIVGSMLPALNALLEKVIAGTKAFGGMWAYIERIGYQSNPFQSAGEGLAEVSREFDRNAGRLEKISGILERGTASEAVTKRYKDEAAGLRERNETLAQYIRYFKESQKIDALRGSGGVLDARDARARSGEPGKKAAPALQDAKAADEAAKQYTALIEKIKAKRAESEAELAVGGKLSDDQKFRLDMLEKINAAESKLSPKQKENLRTEVDLTAATMQRARANDELAKSRKYSSDLAEKNLQAMSSENASILSAVTALEQEAMAYGLTASELDRLTRARLESEIARQRDLLFTAQSVDGQEAEVSLLQQRIALLEKQLAVTGKLQDADRAKREDPATGAMEAVEEYLQRTREAGKAAKDAISGAMSALEDDLVNGLSEGKLNVKGFIDFALKEFLRLQVVKPFMNSLFGGGSGSGVIGGLLSLFGFANGGVFSGGVPIKAFASGGVVGSPTLFGMGGGLGLMGEAGPEAIMPLKRGPDGKLGVAGGGSQTIVNTYNVAAGVTRNELVSALQMLSQQMQAYTDGKMRRAGLA